MIPDTHYDDRLDPRARTWADAPISLEPRTPEIDLSLSVDEYRPAWTPQIGDRVRVRLSAECRAVPRPGSSAARDGIKFGHREILGGRTGRITHVDLKGIPGHTFGVTFDNPVEVAGWIVQGEVLSMTELDPPGDSDV